MATTTTRATQAAQVVTIEAGRLERLAEEINDRWHEVEKADTEGRIAVGRMLIDAKEQVEKGGGSEWIKISWAKWCEHHIERSISDINKVMALAGAPDPLAALEEERKKRRDQMAALKLKKEAAPAITKKDAQLGASGAVDSGNEEPSGQEEAEPEPEQAAVTEIPLSGAAFSKITLDRLCFASFREEIVNGKKVATIICVPKAVDEAVQVAAVKHLFTLALPGARTQIRQWVESGEEAAP